MQGGHWHVGKGCYVLWGKGKTWPQLELCMVGAYASPTPPRHFTHIYPNQQIAVLVILNAAHCPQVSVLAGGCGKLHSLQSHNLWQPSHSLARNPSGPSCQNPGGDLTIIHCTSAHSHAAITFVAVHVATK